MSSDPRGRLVARELRERIGMLDTLVRELDDAHWSRICPGEGWSIGLETYHIALGLARQGGWIIDRIGGAPAHDFSWDDTNELNALVAQTQSWRVKTNVLVFLREQTERVVRLMLRMSPADWDVDALTYKDTRRTAEYVMRSVGLGHIEQHMSNIRAALAAGTPPRDEAGARER